MGRHPRHSLRLAALALCRRLGPCLGAALAFAGCAPATPPSANVGAPTTAIAPPPPAPAPPPPEEPPRVDRGAVASESEAATKAGIASLEAGGTAFDAVVAMAFTAGVTQPTSCGLGGGGFALTWDGAKATIVDFRETAPGGLRLRDHLSTSPPWDKRGVMVGVPGFVSGLAAVHALGGKLPWSDDLSEARRLAEDGFAVEPWLATTVQWSERDLLRIPEAAWLLEGGALPRPGDVRKNAALGRTLGVLAEKGAGAFYRGAIADDVVKSARAAGSTVVGADLVKYAAVTREPLRVRWGSYDVIVPPSPSGGAVMLAQELLVFPPDDVKKLEPGSALYTHLVSEGLREAGAERRAKVGDPAYTRVDEDDLVAAERLRAVRRGLRETTTREPEATLIEDGGTCSLVAWDEAGRVVVVTASVGGMFGAKIATRGGFFLDDSLTDFAHDALAAKVATKGPNFPRAAARPVSSMAPTLLLEGGRPALAVSGSGGGRIPGAILQVMHRALASGATLDEAIAAPRFHPPAAGGLSIEEGLAPIAGALRERGESLEEPRPTFAAVTAIRRRELDGRSVLEAGADPRKRGSAKIWRAPAATAPSAHHAPR